LTGNQHCLQLTDYEIHSVGDILDFINAKIKGQKPKGEGKMDLTRNQFAVLEALAVSETKLTEKDLENITHYTADKISGTARELSEFGYINNGVITSSGINALEPYRVRRAIFIAAGFGTRLVPITFNTPKPLVRVHGVRIIDHLIDACLKAGINEIYIVRGYLAEQFDQLLYKYPIIKFLENPVYNEANNISSALVARDLFSNAYIFEADLLLNNSEIIRKYHYTSNFLAIKKERTDDWCFEVKNGAIIGEKVGGQGENIWQMVGISYWNESDGRRLSQDIADVYSSPGGRERYWEQVPLVYARDRYTVEVRECFDEDIIEIDTFRELKAVDKSYDV